MPLSRTLALALLLALLGGGPALADFKVWTPDVNKGELAAETVGSYGLSPNRANNNEESYTTELEYGVTDWWQTELEAEFEREPGPGHGLYFNQLTSENLFQFTPRGEYWLDAGFFAEYGQETTRGGVSETTFGPIFRKDFWGTSNTINLFLEKELGAHASGRVQFEYAFETRIDAAQVQFGHRFVVEPGFQFYGEPGPLTRFNNWSRQDVRAGPQLFGRIFELGPGTLVWNGGVLFGLTPAVPRQTYRWQAEYEIHY